MPLAEGETIPGGFADPRLPDDDPRKWVARPRDAQMVDDFLAQSSNERLRKCVGKGHLFIDHYATAGWVFGQYKTPIQNWRHLIQQFQFRDPSSIPSHVPASQHRPGTSRRTTQAARPGAAQPLSEGLQHGPPLTGTLDDL